MHLCISYNTGKGVLPDIRIYKHNAGGRTAPKGVCVYIR